MKESREVCDIEYVQFAFDANSNVTGLEIAVVGKEVHLGGVKRLYKDWTIPHVVIQDGNATFDFVINESSYLKVRHAFQWCGKNNDRKIGNDFSINTK